MLTKSQEVAIIAHIAQGVEIEILNYKCDYVGIQFAKANGFYYLLEELHITYEGGSVGKSLNDCRLLLHNLSMYRNYTDVVEEMTDYEEKMLDDNSNHLVLRCSYDVVNAMIRRHLDVFSLIHSQLAKEIITVK